MGAAPGPAAPEEQGVPWGRYLAALRRYSWLVLLCVGLGIAGGLAAGRLATPEYEANAMIWVNTRADQGGPIRAGELLESASWVELLRSFAVADEVTRSLRLYVRTPVRADHAAFATFERTDSTRNGSYVLQVDSAGRQWTLATHDDIVLERGLVGDSVGRRVGMRWLPPAGTLTAGRKLPFHVISVRVASGSVLGRLMAVLPEQGSFMRVSLRGSDPVVTARTLNAMAEGFVSAATSLKRRKATELRGLLESQLRLAESELRTAEFSLERYRAATITLPTENLILAPSEQTRDPALGKFMEQRMEYEEVRHDREALEHALARAPGGGVAPEALLSIGGLATAAPRIQSTVSELTEKEAQLRAARQTLTDQHPTVRQLSEAVRSLRLVTLPQLSRDALAQLREREQQLRARVAGASRELQRIPARTIEEGRLRRQFAVSEQLYDMLRTRHEEAKLAELGAAPDVKILDLAEPPAYPTSNSAPRLLLLAVVAAIGLGVALALLLDRLDRRFRYLPQATHDLGLPVVGAVPHLGRQRRGRVDVELASRMIESFRAIRLGLRYAVGDASPMQLAISSPGKGDGKSFLSANIALAFAQSGCRTLLVDGDMRAGELHRIFAFARVPGLADYLDGTAELSEVTHPGSHEQLSVIPSGTRRSRSAEQIGGPRMQELWRSARAQYDVILVDTPPLSAGIDAFALAAQAGHLAIVLRTGMTDRKMAAAKLAVVDRLPIHVVGALINDAPNDGEYAYYSYSYKADADEDGDPGWASIPALREHVPARRD